MREHAVELQAVEVDRLRMEIDDVEGRTRRCGSCVSTPRWYWRPSVQVGGLAERKRNSGRGDRGHDVEREQKRGWYIGGCERMRMGASMPAWRNSIALFDRGSAPDASAVRSRARGGRAPAGGAQVAMRHLDVSAAMAPRSTSTQASRGRVSTVYEL